MNLLHFFAGVDDKVFDVVGSDEKRFIRQIGFVQLLVFVFLVVAIFISFDYLTVERVADFSIDGELTITEKRSVVYEVIIGLLSVFVATMVVLLDRTLVMSDWYFQDTDETGGFAKVWRTLKRWFRIIPRVAISLFIAYTLTLFLLLRFYDSSLVNLLKADYAKHNEAIVAKVTEYKKRLDADLSTLQDKATSLRNKINNPSLLMTTADNVLASLTSQKNEKIEQLEGIERRMDEITRSEAYRRWTNLTYRAQCAQSLLDLEAHSEDRTPQTVCGQRYTPSGIRGEGPRYRTLQARRDAIRNDLSAFETAHPEFTTTLPTLEAQARTVRTEIGKLNASIEQRRRYLNDQRVRRIEENREQARRDLKKTLDEIERFKQHYHDRLAEYKQNLLKSVNFRNFEDGPLVRHIMLKRLFNDETYGEERRWFSNMLKAMLIVIELMPLIMKVFFAPPGIYGLILQRRLACMKATLAGEACAEAFSKSLTNVAKVTKGEEQ